MITDWRRELAILAYVKNAIFDLDMNNLWRHELQRVGASESQVRAAEAVLGGSLDPRYLAFLACANGWPAFYQDVDLFGTDELMGGGQMARALSLLDSTEPDVFSEAGVPRSSLLPIAVSSTDLDLFVLVRQGSAPAGSVIWLAGNEVDRFSHFDEFFLAMVDYNRLDYQKLKQARALQ